MISVWRLLFIAVPQSPSPWDEHNEGLEMVCVNPIYLITFYIIMF